MKFQVERSVNPRKQEDAAVIPAERWVSSLEAKRRLRGGRISVFSKLTRTIFAAALRLPPPFASRDRGQFQNFAHVTASQSFQFPDGTAQL